MYFSLPVISMTFGYLAGRISFGILITGWVRGIEKKG